MVSFTANHFCYQRVIDVKEWGLYWVSRLFVLIVLFRGVNMNIYIYVHIHIYSRPDDRDIYSELTWLLRTTIFG